MAAGNTQAWIQLKYFELLGEAPCENETLGCVCSPSPGPLPWEEHKFWRRMELGANPNAMLTG